jgi:hypothetical protein
MVPLLLCLAGPVPAQDGNEDLEVTMEVLDSESEVGVLMKEMRGPDRSMRDPAPARPPAASEDDEKFDDLESRDDGFYSDELFRNDPLIEEDDFESLEGEDLDLDIATDVTSEDPGYEPPVEE